ncbi:MAG: HAD hydrolase family protein, partial [Rikenellaceae bacterium]
LTDIYLGCLYKIESLDDFRYKYGIERSEILYMGDDMPDIEAMQNVGLAVAPADAVLEVKAVAHHVSEYGGGKGCVRDVIEQVLKSQGQWNLISHSSQ